MTKRKLIRHLPRNPHRSPLRHVTRMLHGARRPNHLAVALTAFSRAIRAHRRLIKLAPRFFDSAVVDREAVARHDEIQSRRQWIPVLNKVYGLPPDDSEPILEPHWYPAVPKSQRVILTIDSELASWQFWMNAGREAMIAFQQRPHALIPFPQLARLLEISFIFGRLACGEESPQSV